MILFNSWPYIAFLFVVTSLHWFSPKNNQNRILLVSSLIFYGSWSRTFLLLLLFSTSIDFFAAQWISRSHDGQRRKLWLYLSVGANLAILGVFKYFNFFISDLDLLLKCLHVTVEELHLSVVLPIGISFYTFQAISYVVDVYRGEIAAENYYPDYLLFIVFFAQLVAGPIERAKNLLVQYKTKREFRHEQFFEGIDLIIWGLLKKIVIADNISYYVNNIFHLKDPSTLLMVIGSFAYGVVIFSDFSGYSDMARGSAKLFGIEIMKNFNWPYWARNPSDFWRRWHISLSNFVRDYVYIPLGGDRCSGRRYLFNILVAWFLMGLWHGASWHFVLWGLFHGSLVVSHRLFTERFGFIKKLNSRFFSFMSILATYLLVNLGWLIFRINDIPSLMAVFSKNALKASGADISVTYIIFIMIVFYSVPYLVFHIFRIFTIRSGISLTSSGPLRIIYYFIALIVMLLFGELSHDFIYFQF